MASSVESLHDPRVRAVPSHARVHLVPLGAGCLPRALTTPVVRTARGPTDERLSDSTLPNGGRVVLEYLWTQGQELGSVADPSSATVLVLLACGSLAITGMLATALLEVRA